MDRSCFSVDKKAANPLEGVSRIPRPASILNSIPHRVKPMLDPQCFPGVISQSKSDVVYSMRSVLLREYKQKYLNERSRVS